MGAPKQVTTTEIPGMGQEESSLLSLFERLSGEAGGQLGDLGDLAAGQIGGPTTGDIALVEQAQAAAADIARRRVQADLEGLQSQLGEQLSERGVGGSSIESVQRAILQRQGLQQLGDIASQQQGQTAQALQSAPLQRAAMQLNANQALLQRLTGLGGTALNSRLSDRLAQQTTTAETQGGEFGQALQIGGMIGGAAIGGPAGAAAGGQIGSSLGGGGFQPGSTQSSFDAFNSSGLGSLGRR